MAFYGILERLATPDAIYGLRELRRRSLSAHSLISTTLLH